MTGRAWRSFDVIAHVLGDRLRGSEASPELRAMVRAHAIDWERVLRQASGDLVLPALAAALRDLDLSRSVDEELRAFLEAVHGANVERNRELRGELRAVIGVLNRVGIEPVLLKGAIRLVDGLYPDDGWRMLRDLDLLVPEARWAAAVQALQRAGYTLGREAATAAVLRRPGGPVTIDVHTEPFSTPSRQGLLSGEEVLNGARPAVIGNAVVRLPSLLHQMIHLIPTREQRRRTPVKSLDSRAVPKDIYQIIRSTRKHVGAPGSALFAPCQLPGNATRGKI
jgi:Uncharacterised nucleotidyltransferase